MKNLDLWVPDVLLQAPGCPDQTARKEVLRACRDLCRRSWVWQEPGDDMPVMASLREYEVESPVNEAQVISIVAMQHDDVPLEPLRPMDATRMLGGDWRNQTGHARFWVHETPKTFRLVPQPTERNNRGLTGIVVALEPKMDANRVGDILHDEFEEVVLAGALSRVFGHRGQEWYDPNESRAYAAVFEAGVSQAKYRMVKGYSARRGKAVINRLAGTP